MASLPVTTSKRELRIAHRLKMKKKRDRRAYGDRASHRHRYDMEHHARYQNRGDFTHSIWPEHKFAKPGRMA